MKSLIPILILSAVAFSGTKSDLRIGNRTGSIYAPDKRNKPALVISMHGIGGGAWWTPGAMQFEPYADTANFVVVYPDGEGSQWDLGGDKDINFLLAIIDEMATKYDIDRDRVYVSGFSMGGMMTWYASCKIPDKIAAIIPGDGYPLYGMSGCSEVRHVPVLHIHGSADDFVSYSGLTGSFIPDQVKRYGCPETAVRTKPYPVGVNGRNAETLANPNHSFKDYWGPCEKDGLKSEITLITVAGMGHDWATPGKICGSTDPTYDGKPYEVNGTWEMVNWMLTQSLKGPVNVKPSLNVVTTGKGAVDLSPIGPSYDKGTKVTLTAKPQAGWAFDSWSGTGVSGNTNPLVITFDTTRTITAKFTRLPYSNLEVNGDFGAGAEGWTFNNWGGTATGSVVDGEYKIQIDGLGDANSSIQVVQNGIFLETGKTYEVKFDAYAASNRTLEANVELDIDPWTSYLSALKSFDLTTIKTPFSYTFTMAAPTDSNGRISFNAGASTETVYLDNISIKEVAGTAIRADRHPVVSPALVQLDHSRLKVDFNASQGDAVKAGVFDLKGNKVRSESFRAGSGPIHSWTSDLAGMPMGVYAVRVEVGGDAIQQSKFMYGN